MLILRHANAGARLSSPHIDRFRALDEVRRIRDDIDARVQCLLADLTQTQRGGHVATLSCRATGIRSRRLRSHEDP